MKNISKKLTAALIVGIFVITSLQAKAHCEIPCGIYGDSVRIALLYEHIETIEKSMNQINELSKAETPDYNQLVRWVMNKEEHAKKIQEIVSQYFLHQRVKPTSSADDAAYRKYVKQLELLHHISVFAMKSKQSTDLGIIDTLRDKVHLFEHAYFDEHKH
uniref:superoxide dismutase [Ni] n=1 Tax=uncultured Draconibacterium sp. TaxID=1573823 RepID=UPI0032166D01